MNNQEHQEKTQEADVQKQNQDFPNIPASSEKILSHKTIQKQVKESSEMHKDGKTDNTEKNRGK